MQHESITNTRKARMKKVVVATLVLVVMFTLFALLDASQADAWLGCDEWRDGRVRPRQQFGPCDVP